MSRQCWFPGNSLILLGTNTHKCWLTPLCVVWKETHCILTWGIRIHQNTVLTSETNTLFAFSSTELNANSSFWGLLRFKNVIYYCLRVYYTICWSLKLKPCVSGQFVLQPPVCHLVHVITELHLLGNLWAMFPPAKNTSSSTLPRRSSSHVGITLCRTHSEQTWTQTFQSFFLVLSVWAFRPRHPRSCSLDCEPEF